MAAFLEVRASAPDQQRLHQALVDLLAPQTGERLLDLGCGTGVVARRLAARVGISGKVVGVDISPTMISAAQATNHIPTLEYVTGDATALDYPAGSFDGAAAARLLLHVPRPAPVLLELRRVVRPGGRLAILEWDWGTLAVDHSDRPLTRRILDWRCDHTDGNNWMGRQLVRLCIEAGWHVRDVHPLVSVARDDQGILVNSLRHAAARVLNDGAISTAEHDRWLREIDERLAEGTFFATINDYLVLVEA